MIAELDAFVGMLLRERHLSDVTDFLMLADAYEASGEDDMAAYWREMKTVHIHPNGTVGWMSWLGTEAMSNPSKRNGDKLVVVMGDDLKQAIERRKQS